MDITKSYRIERLTRENISDVEKLFFTVYKRKAGENFFLNKYNTAYTGKSFMGFVAYSNENIPIAFNGIIPCYIDYFGEKILAAQYADVMTHPAYRLKRLFVDVSNYCNALCRAEDIQFLFAFPNQNSYHAGVTKLGWKTIETMDCFTIPAKRSPIQNIISRIPVIKNFLEIKKRKELNTYITGDAGIGNNLAKEGFATVYRDKNYFEYKNYNRHYVIQTGSSKAWIKIDSNLTIGDIELNENNLDDIIIAVQRIGEAFGVKNIYFHACKQTRLHNLFQQQYASIPSFPVLFQNFNNKIHPEKIKFSFADIDIF